MVQFRKAAIAHETTVKVGLMTKPQAVEVQHHKNEVFIHVKLSDDWVSRALFGVGRSRRPPTGKSHILDILMKIGLGGEVEDSVDSALAEDDDDPLGALLAQDTEEQLETPK